MLFLYALLRLQSHLPLSLGFPGVAPAQAFNTAVSFVTNTNWQSYSGESTMGHLAQMSGLAVQNFVSAAVGMAVAVALIRGFTRSRTDRIGNFWVDLVRGILRILLPLAVVSTLALVALGAVQNFASGADATTLTGVHQTITGGPVASQEAIKDLGTNGGGFYNANSSHPFENPNALSNILEIFLLLLIPVSLTRTFGLMVKDKRQGYAILAAMGVLWATILVGVTVAESHHRGTALNLAGASMEGKETRFGVGASALFATSTTGTSTGSVNSFHDSFTALGGGQLIFNMGLGEVAPGGVGTGLYGILVLAIVSGVRRRADGRAHAGVPAQEDHRARDQACLALDPDHAGARAGRDRACDGPVQTQGVHPELRPARAVRGPLRVHVGDQQQRFRLRGDLGQHRLLQHGARLVHARRAIRADHPRDRAGRLAGPPAAGASHCRHPAHPPPAVHRDARRRHRHRGRPHLLPGAGARPDGGGPVMSTTTNPADPQDSATPPEGRLPMAAATPAATRVQGGLLDPRMLLTSLPDAARKLDPRVMVRNPVMFVVETGAALSTVLAITDPSLFGWLVVVWLWLTVVFANLAEAVAEGRGKAQAASLRRAKTETIARRLRDDGSEESIPGPQLRVGDRVVVEAGETIPGDGDVVEGVASVDESAITGESAPVIRESGGDRSSVTGGTKVLSDRIVVAITAKPGESFIDRMIALVEGASRQKTPNEIALNILLASLTIVFLMATVTLQPFAIYSGAQQSLIVLTALLVCLIPTTIGALLSAIGIAGMDRLVQHNVLAMSGRAVEAAGDVNTLLLDKTGTITLGNRQAAEFLAVDGVAAADLADAAQLSSLADETPEGRSIVVLAKTAYGLRERAQGELRTAHFVPFTAQTRMSGVDLDGGRRIRKGAAAAVMKWVRDNDGHPTEEVGGIVDAISTAGGTPLVVADCTGGTARTLGVIHLKDVVKEGMRERFDEMRRMGIRTVMITGDNPLTARSIAEEAGVDDFLAEATPEDKMALIKREQEGGRLVAMTGDGTNDAPALAQADVGVAMNTGTSAAKEAGNMVDLDSNPTKLIEIVEIGKQLLITRGSLTTFSIANDIAKYFAIIPAMFAGVFVGLDKLNIMRLATPESAILSAVIFNALIIIGLIPLALRGVRYRPSSAAQMLRRNLVIYGLGGIVSPFIGIKLIDLLISQIPGIG